MFLYDKINKSFYFPIHYLRMDLNGLVIHLDRKEWVTNSYNFNKYNINENMKDMKRTTIPIMTYI